MAEKGPAVVTDGALGTDVPDVVVAAAIRAVGFAAASDTAGKAGAVAGIDDDFDTEDLLLALLPPFFLVPALPNKLSFCADNDIGVA